MPPAAPALVILDCDGVLVDSEPLAVRLEAAMATDLGWSLSEADVVERFLGRSDAYLLGELEGAIGRPIPDWPERYEAALFESFRKDLSAVDGIQGALDVLDELGVPTCVASSGTHTKLRLTLGLTGLLDRFDGRIFSATEVERGKPAPDLFLHAAREMAVEPSACVVVEDSRSGVEAARLAGMRCVAYCGGLTPRAWLTGPGTIVIDTMADLVAALVG